MEYPPDTEGPADVVIELTVTAEGRVSDVRLISGKPPFSEVALRSAPGFLFKPALRHGRPVAARIRYGIHFEPERIEPESTPTPKQPAPAAPASPADRAQQPPPKIAARPLEVVVEGERRTPGGTIVTREEARLLPGTFGDPLRAVEAQPGVTPIVSGLPYFFVRGAPPANVGFFIDGVDVPLLYHAFIGPSVLHPGVIDDITFYRGASPVEYGRFAGPVVAARTLPPSERLRGEASVRAIDSGALVEGPFGSCENAAGTECHRGSALIAGRYSYTGAVLSLFSDAKLRYWDYQARARYAIGAHDELSIFAFGAYDYFSNEATEDKSSGLYKVGAETLFHRIDLRWDHRIGASTRVRLAATGGFDRTGDESSVVRDRSVRARLELEHRFSEGATLEAGLDARWDDFNLDANRLDGPYMDYATLFPSRTERVVGAYVSAHFAAAPGIVLVPGLRADVYNSQGDTRGAIDPRIAAVFDISRKFTIEHAIGVAHQPPNFVPGVPGAQVADLRGGLQEAWLVSSTARWKPDPELTAEVSVFRTGYFNALDPIGGTRDFTVDFNVLNHRATLSSVGVELKLSRPLTRRVGGFIAYTLSRTEESSGTWHSISGYDRPHVLQAALSYNFGAGFRAGVRGVYYSGIPARIVGPPLPVFDAHRRAPAYYRLDVRAEKRWRLGANGYLGVVGEVLNATLMNEVLGFDCGTRCSTYRAGLVVLPSIGVEGAL